MKQQTFSVEIDFIINWSNIKLDLNVYKKSNVNFKNIQTKLSFSEFLESFNSGKVLIFDYLNTSNSILLKGSIIGFFYNVYSCLLKIQKDKSYRVSIFGVEDDEYFIKCYKKNENFIIENVEKRVEYNFNAFMKLFKNIYANLLLEELPLYYPGIQKCEYYLKITNEHKVNFNNHLEQ